MVRTGCPMTTTNYTLRDEIRDYWSARAATFDQQVGHEIVSEAERQAWRGLVLRHLRPGADRRGLHPAGGAGGVSPPLDGLGVPGTGRRRAEAELAPARATAGARGGRV